MWYSPVASFAVILLPILAGYLIVPYMPIRPGVRRAGSALLIGMGILTVVLSWLGAFWGSVHYQWALLGATVIPPFAIPACRRALIADGKHVAVNPRVWASLLFPITIIGYLNAPNLLPGGPVFFEAGPNHDVLHWVVCAQSLQEQGYLFPDIELNAGQSIFRQFAGWWTWDGRLGSELFLGWLSGLLGVHAALIYNAFSAAMLIPWMAGVILLADYFRGRPVGPWGVIWAAPVEAAFVFYYNMGNLPNLLGSILAGGAAIVFFVMLRRRGHSPWLRFLVPSLMINAILATYPELLPFLVLGLCLVVATEARHGAVFANLRYAVGVFALSALWNPISCVRGIGTVWMKSSSSTNSTLPRIFDHLEYYQFLPAWITIDPSLGDDMSFWLGILFSGALLVTAFVGMRASRHRGLASVGLVILGLLGTISFAQDFQYGYQKAIQNSGIFIYALLLCGLLASLEMPVLSVKSIFARIAAALTSLLLLVSLVHLAFIGQRHGAQKNLPAATFALDAKLRTTNASHSAIILDNGFLEPFFYSAWLPFAMKGAITEFPRSSDQSRWYQSPWPEHDAAKAQPKYLLTAASMRNRLFAINEDPVYLDDIVAVYANGLGRLETHGIGNRIANRCPIVGERFDLRMTSGQGWIVTVGIAGDDVPTGEQLSVTLNGERYPATLTAGTYRASLPLRGAEGNRLVIELPHTGANKWWLTELTFEKIGDPVPIAIDGAFEWEGIIRWMSDAVSVSSLSPTPGWLNVQVHHFYNRLPPETRLIVERGDERIDIDPERAQAGFSIPLEAGDSAPLILRSSHGALAPKDMGESADDRRLSFALSTLEASTAPLFAPLDQ